MPSGSYWSEGFIRQLDEPGLRHAYMADQVRTRIALQIKALREQDGREWSQVELARRSGKHQNVISRIENPDYGQLTLQTLFDMAEAFDLPIYIDFMEWEDWLERMHDLSPAELSRRSFDLDHLVAVAHANQERPTAAAAAAATAQMASTQSVLIGGQAQLALISHSQPTSAVAHEVANQWQAPVYARAA